MVRVGIAVAAVLSACVWAAPAHAFSSEQALAYLNLQRAASGLPGPLINDGALAQGCREFINYLELNKGPDQDDPHKETPGKPGYTAAGDQAARVSGFGARSPGVLASAWTPTDSVFAGQHAYSVLHNIDLYEPTATTFWWADNDRYHCTGTRGGRAASGTFSYPGGGIGGVPATTKFRDEYPYAPGSLVGLAPGTATGPHIYAWAIDRQRAESFAGAALYGPSGRVDVTVVRPDTPVPGGRTWGQTWGAGMAVVIPKLPLQPNATYSAVIDWTVKDASGAVAPIRHLGRFCTIARTIPGDPSPAAVPSCTANQPKASLPLTLSRAGRNVGVVLPALMLPVTVHVVVRGARRSCVRGRCRTRTTKRASRKIATSGGPFAVTLPRRRKGERFTVSLSVPAVQLSDGPHAATRVTRRGL